MSLALYFSKKCLDKLKENVRLTVLQLSDPASIINIEVTGALADAATGDFGSLGSYAQEYLEDNALELGMMAAQAAGIQDKILNAIDLLYNLMALALMANNELIMYFMKKIAKNCLKELDTKDGIITELMDNMLALYNALLALSKGDPVWDQYLQQLREGLALLDKARQDMILIRNTLSRSNYYLSNKFEDVKTGLDEARDKILPLNAGDNPYLEPFSRMTNTPGSSVNNNIHNFAKGIAKNLGIPDYKSQTNNILAIPRISKEVLKSAQGYFETTLKINALVLAFIVGVNQLNELLPDFFKKHILKLFDRTLKKMDNLVWSMAYKINGDENAIYSPLSGYEPTPLNVSVNAFKWAMDLELIIQSLTLIPHGALTDLMVSKGAMDAYIRGVNKLKSMDGVSSPGATLNSTDAQEDLGRLEIQLMLFLIQAQTAIVTCEASPQILSVGRGILSYLELAQNQDDEIRQVMENFIATPLQFEDTLEKIGQGLFDLMSDLGMDAAQNMLTNGDFTSFLHLNPANATYVGGALAAVALLKECFPNPEDEAELTKIQRELERDKDLLNIDISFNFQLAIFDNLQSCIDLKGLSKLFNLKEIICGLLEASGAGSAFNKLEDLLSF